MEREQKLYTGIARCSLVAVNPDDGWLELNAPWARIRLPYHGRTGSLADSQRYSFVCIWLETDPQEHFTPDGTPLAALLRLGIPLFDEVKTNPRNGFRRIIDSYGRGAWVDEETFRNHGIPVNRKGERLAISEDWHPCLAGEENLVKFVKILLGIPNVMRHTRDGFVPIDNPDDAVCDLQDVVAACLDNDWKPLFDILDSCYRHKVKVLAGVGHDHNLNPYQTVYNNWFSPVWMDKDKRFRSAVVNDTTIDRNIVWSFGPLKEYTD